MSSIGHRIPTTSSSHSYADEASQVYLRTLDGNQGTYRRNERGTNLADIVNRHSSERN